MNPAPVLIRVTCAPVRVAEPKLLQFRRANEAGVKTIARPAQPKVRVRFSAKFVGGPFNGLTADGYESADDAIGGLIAAAAGEHDNLEDVLCFLASLFGVDPVRTWQAQLGRAVRLANKTRRRVHPGAKVLVPDMQPITAAAATSGRDSGAGTGGVA